MRQRPLRRQYIGVSSVSPLVLQHVPPRSNIYHLAADLDHHQDRKNRNGSGITDHHTLVPSLSSENVNILTILHTLPTCGIDRLKQSLANMSMAYIDAQYPIVIHLSPPPIPPNLPHSHHYHHETNNISTWGVPPTASLHGHSPHESLHTTLRAEYVHVMEQLIRQLTREHVLPVTLPHTNKDTPITSIVPITVAPQPPLSLSSSLSNASTPQQNNHHQITTIDHTIQEEISSGTSQGTVYMTRVYPNMYLCYIVDMNGRQLMAIMKKSPIYDVADWRQYVYWRRQCAQSLLHGVRQHDGDCFAPLGVPGGTVMDRHDIHDPVAGDTCDACWNAVDDRAPCHHVSMACHQLQQLECRLSSQFQDVSNEAYVDTIGLYLGSRLVEVGVSSFFPLFYGSLRVYDSKYFSEVEQRRYGAALNEYFPVQLTLMQPLDGSMNDLIHNKWFFVRTETMNHGDDANGRVTKDYGAKNRSLSTAARDTHTSITAQSTNNVITTTTSHHQQQHNNNHQWESSWAFDCHRFMAVFAQIVFGLNLGQTLFSLVHNDLHPGNILYRDVPHDTMLYYYRRSTGKYYAVPTYGKEMKMIDFERATMDLGTGVIGSKDAAIAVHSEMWNLQSKSNDLLRLLSTVLYVMEDDMHRYQRYSNTPCITRMNQFIAHVLTCDRGTQFESTVLNRVEQCVREETLRMATARIHRLLQQKQQSQTSSTTNGSIADKRDDHDKKTDRLRENENNTSQSSSSHKDANTTTTIISTSTPLVPASEDTSFAPMTHNATLVYRTSAVSTDKTDTSTSSSSTIQQQHDCTIHELAIRPFVVGSTCQGGVPAANIRFFDMFLIPTLPTEGVHRVLLID